MKKLIVKLILAAVGMIVALYGAACTWIALCTNIGMCRTLGEEKGREEFKNYYWAGVNYLKS